MIKKRPELRAYLMLGLVMLFWAGNSIVGRAVRDDIPPFTLAFVRWTGALILLAPFAIGPLRRDAATLWRHGRTILFLGLVGIATFNALLYSGLHHTTAANALLLQALIPPLILLFGALFFGERAPLLQIGGVLLSGLGVAAIVFQGDPAAIANVRFNHGDGLILVACIAWSVYTVGLRLSPAVQPISFVFATFTIGAVAMAPLAIGEGAFSSVDQLATQPNLAAFGYVALFPSLIAYFLYNVAVARVGSGAAGQTISLMPLFGAFLAVLVLDEPLHGYHVVGMALILGGIAIAALAAAKVRPAQ